MGNSPKAARKHYLQTTEAHFEKATQLPSALARNASHERAFCLEKNSSPAKTLVENSRGGTRTRAENSGETALLYEGDAKSEALTLGRPQSSGTVPPDSDCYSYFVRQLTEQGFTGPQLLMMNDALREAGLQIVPAES